MNTCSSINTALQNADLMEKQKTDLFLKKSACYYCESWGVLRLVG